MNSAPLHKQFLSINLRAVLSAADVCTFFMLGLNILFGILTYTQIPMSGTIILVNIMISFGVVGLIVADTIGAGTMIAIARRFYLVVLVPTIYEQTLTLLPAINPHDVDTTLIALDYALIGTVFGDHPTRLLAHITHPMLTEYLQFTYMLFFFLPVMQGVELVRKERDADVLYFAYTIGFGFFISYLLYYLAPAIGPRFTLHEFSKLSQEMPGVLLADFFRDVVNAGAGLRPNIPNPAEIVHRDCMPSGHTMMTLVNIFLAFKYHSRLRWFFVVIGGSLIFATLYLRYHYVVDVLAGTICAVVTYWLAPRFRLWLYRQGFPSA
jgi:membrane-associated phospholipid phosphatase